MFVTSPSLFHSRHFERPLSKGFGPNYIALGIYFGTHLEKKSVRFEESVLDRTLALLELLVLIFGAPGLPRRNPFGVWPIQVDRCSIARLSVGSWRSFFSFRISNLHVIVCHHSISVFWFIVEGVFCTYVFCVGLLCQFWGSVLHYLVKYNFEILCGHW